MSKNREKPRSKKQDIIRFDTRVRCSQNMFINVFLPKFVLSRLSLFFTCRIWIMITGTVQDNDGS